MMKGSFVAFVAATLLTVTAGVVAQSSGFPSRPRFQKVAVRSNDAQKIELCRLNATATRRCASVEIGNTGNFYIFPADDTGVGTGTALLEGVRSATGTWSGVNLNGAAVPKIAFATFIGGCAAGNTSPSGSYASYGVASCANTGSGQGTVTLNVGFASTPSCVASEVTTGTPAAWATAAGSATSVQWRRATGGDVIFTITCYGF